MGRARIWAGPTLKSGAPLRLTAQKGGAVAYEKLTLYGEEGLGICASYGTNNAILVV